MHEMDRREFLAATAAGALTSWSSRLIRLPLPANAARKALRLAAITDLHHGLAPDALSRFDTFLAATRQRPSLDAVLQLGDFTYSDAGAADCLARWSGIPHPTLSVLGNHDMDKCDKATVVKALAMPSRYYTQVVGDYRFVVLDLNHFRKDGTLTSYANGNYFIDNATFNLADPEQLAWLNQTLRASKEPVILLSHQPLGFAEPGQPMPPEQVEVLEVVTAAAKANPRGAVAAILFGHLHVDRLEHVGNIPCLCLNSASYFWSGGMVPYTTSLYAFLEVTPEGMLRVDGVAGAWTKEPPAASDKVIGRSASLSNRVIETRLHASRG